MEVHIKRLNQDIHFEGSNPNGISVSIDGSSAEGGEGKGARPMEVILMGLGSCSGIDVVLILKKMKQDLVDMEIKVEGERREEIPRIFTKIHVHYTLYGNIDQEKARRAIELSMEKYCSVTAMLEKVAEITYTFEVIKADSENGNSH